MRQAVVVAILAAAVLGVVAVGASGCGDGAGGGDDDAPDAAPPYTPRTIQFTTGDWSVASGTEVTRCLYSKLPGDDDFLVGAYRAEMLAQSHHFNMFYADPMNPLVVGKPLDTLTDCDYGFKNYLAGSQWTSVDESIPAHLGLRIPAGSILVLESHYVNVTDGDIPARVDVEFDSANPALVTDEIGLYFNVMEDIDIAPGEHVRLSASCPTDADVNLVLLTSHTHHHAQSFEINQLDEASGDTTQIYLSEDYAHPIIDKRYDQPLYIGAGQSLEWACNYHNDSALPVVTGDSALNDEMCIMAAFYYPKRSPQPYCFAQAQATPLP